MPVPSQFGGSVGAIPVNAATPYTVPSSMVIYAIVPQPAWTGKAIGALEKGFQYAHLTADRTSTGGDVAQRTAPTHGAYSSITVATGEVDVYIRPKNEV